MDDGQRTDNKLLLTTSEAANRLGIGRSKFYEIVGEGKIRTVRIGRAVRVPTREIERFVDKLVEEAERDRTAIEKPPACADTRTRGLGDRMVGTRQW